MEGKTSLLPIEIKELGDVNGKSLLHLQCHFGMDTLSWARKGAKVTGVDFSDKAIELAKQLSKELNIPAKFIQSNVYDIPNILKEKFDIVFTSYGVLCWLPDLIKWAEVIIYYLKPGCTFYIIEGHPFGSLIDENFGNSFQVVYNYFTERNPTQWDEDGTYADPNAKLKHITNYQWDHTLSDIINALLNVNLELEFFHEFPFTFHNLHPDLKRRDDGYWEFQNLEFSVPMMFSIKAHKKI
ncbi:MAG: class I SAM-dependent methyltransferase [Candidatus Lokiarchaeota archaeon]|nr:class I SAM-dependent methyltransferase [Candidatus Lokiarchaeota archaeon]